MADPVYSTTRPIPAQALVSLFAQTEWATKRTPEQIERMLAHCLSMGVWDGDALIGYGRAVTDGVYRALVEDIVVDAAWRGQGIGGEIVRQLVEALEPVEQLILNCHESLIPFYASFGFSPVDMPYMQIWKGD